MISNNKKNLFLHRKINLLRLLSYPNRVHLLKQNRPQIKNKTKIKVEITSSIRFERKSHQQKSKRLLAFKRKGISEMFNTS